VDGGAWSCGAGAKQQAENNCEVVPIHTCVSMKSHDYRNHPVMDAHRLRTRERL
jgi:hypothetical protein